MKLNHFTLNGFAVGRSQLPHASRGSGLRKLVGSSSLIQAFQSCCHSVAIVVSFSVEKTLSKISNWIALNVQLLFWYSLNACCFLGCLWQGFWLL